ncbi:hypothetical protein [Nereida ignava]|uniref:hypothetical protein n=1 Tax=Nereida ignava TaxID=282199 RepID=UPI0030FA24A2
MAVWERGAHPATNKPRYKYIDHTVAHPLLTVDETEKYHKLAFVEAGKGYNLKRLMEAFDAWALDRDPHKKKILEDDALFKEGNCLFRALFQRVLTNQGESIYKKYGYKPDFSKASLCGSTTYTKADYDADLAYLASTKATLWHHISEYILPRTAVKLTDSSSLLGKMLENTSCEKRRLAYNDIGVALSKYRKTGEAPVVLQPFLEAMCHVEQIHQQMIKT